jgi:hypothetical protein
MDEDRENVIDYRLHELHARGDTLEVLAALIGRSRDEVRQRINRYDDRVSADTNVPASAVRASVSEDDPRTALCEALAWGDEDAFTSTMAENPELFRWINPASLDGPDELRSFHADQAAQLAEGDDRKPSMDECVTVVLPTNPSPMVSIELLRAVIPRAKKLVLISSRTSLRLLLADPF